jgi:hypothetical protein
VRFLSLMWSLETHLGRNVDEWASVYFEERSVPIKLAFLRQITQIDAKLLALIFYRFCLLTTPNFVVFKFKFLWTLKLAAQSNKLIK